MRDCLEFLKERVQDYDDSKRLQQHLIELLQSLYTQLETERGANAELRQQILNLTKQDTLGIVSKYANLKAKNSTLEEKLSSLKNEIDDLNIQLISKSQEMKHLLSEQEAQLTSGFLAQLNEKNSQLEEKHKEIENVKKKFRQKEQELYNEIQAAEATSVIELDKIENDLRKQLFESGKKLKDSMHTCNILRMELMAVKEQFSEHKRSSNEKIAELQKMLREGQSREDWSLQTKEASNNDDRSSKYKPLDVSLAIPEDRPINLKKAPVYRGSGNLVPTYALSSKEPREKSNKRRKLFNPDDLTYLSDFPDKE